MTDITLEEAIKVFEGLGSKINVSSTSRLNLDFNRYYLDNRKQMLKLYGWALYHEDGIELTGEKVDIGFSDSISPDEDERPICFLEGIPFEVLQQTGYEVGDRLGRLTVFLELDDFKINLYLAKPHKRQLSRRRYREIRAEIRETIGDFNSSDDY